MIDACKAVFFDAGGTLLHPHPSVGRIYQEVAGRYGCRTDADDLEERFRAAWKKRDGLSSLSSHADEKIEREWWRSLVEEVFTQIGGIEPFDDFFTELYDVFGRPESWKLYPEAIEVLEELHRRGKKIGVISNWDSRLFHLIEEFAIQPYFEVVLASAVFGISKPNAKIFEEALRQVGLNAHETVHIGDSIEDDIHGAVRVGMRAVLVDRHGHETAGLSKEVRVIRNLRELIE